MKRYNKKKKFILIIAISIIILGIFNVFDIYGFKKNSNENKNLSENKYIKKKVLIDAGHGGSDQGTHNPRTGTIEKNLTLQISNKVIKFLGEYDDIEVVGTRSTDRNVSLRDRNNIEVEENADIFVSIHCNATPDGSSTANGVESFYWKNDTDSSLNLAQEIHESIISSLNVRDRGVKRGNYKVLRDSIAPSVLIETGFLTDDQEEQNLLNEDYQEELAKAIANGIVDYLREK